MNSRNKIRFGVSVSHRSAVGSTVGSAVRSTVASSAVGSTIGSVVGLLCWFRGYIDLNVKMLRYVFKKSFLFLNIIFKTKKIPVGVGVGNRSAVVSLALQLNLWLEL